MGESLLDADLYGAGIALMCEHFQSGRQDFVRLAQTIALELNTEPVALRRYLRSWYNGARYACIDNGIPVNDAWSDDEIETALAAIDDWGWGPYPPDFAPASERDGAEVADGHVVNDLRRLMGIALTTPTPEAVMSFVAFASRLKRLAPYNIMMVFTQRPGARAIGTREEWHAAGQQIRPDAIPVLVLKPFRPIIQVFELADTLPPRDNDPRTDPFAATGSFRESRLADLIAKLLNPPKRQLKIDVQIKDYGSGLAGQIVRFGALGDQAGGEVECADDHAVLGQTGLSTYSITLNHRLTAPQQFVTLLHELGHLFCGHLGAFDADNPAADEYGWPDRRGLSHAAKEIEAELVAYHIAERENLVTGAPLYLKSYMEKSPQDVGQVDLDRAVRAIARVRQYLGDP